MRLIIGLFAFAVTAFMTAIEMSHSPIQAVHHLRQSWKNTKRHNPVGLSAHVLILTDYVAFDKLQNYTVRDIMDGRLAAELVEAPNLVLMSLYREMHPIR